MNDMKLFDILNNADNETIELLSQAVEFTTSRQRQELFSRSIKKAEETKVSERGYSNGMTVSGTERYRRHTLAKVAGIIAPLIVITGGTFALYHQVREKPEPASSSEATEINNDYSRDRIVEICGEEGINAEAPEYIPAYFYENEPDVKPYIIQFIFEYKDSSMNLTYLKNPVEPDKYKEFFTSGGKEASESDIEVNGHSAKLFEQQLNGKYFAFVAYEKDGVMTVYSFENVEPEQIRAIADSIR